MAEQQQTSGLLAWLLGGLVVGGILLGLLIAAYEIGYHRGQHHTRAASPATSPTPAHTTPSTPSTTPATTTPPTSAALVAKGKLLYTTDGCAACHSLTGAATVGPTFKGLPGSTVTLTTGQTVKADDAYLDESIRNPDAQIAKGYHPGIMGPAIASFHLATNPQDIAALVAFINTKK